MAEEKKEELNYQFVSLVFSLQQAAMAQMGKIANPATGKMERNLAQTKATIDMLEMLKEKSKGNLSDTEQKIILNTLDNLYLNYADEVEKSSSAKAMEDKESKEEKPVTAEAQKEKPAEGAERKREKAKEKKPSSAEATEGKEEKKE